MRVPLILCGDGEREFDVPIPRSPNKDKLSHTNRANVAIFTPIQFPSSMASKKKPVKTPVLSTSTDLVPVGARHVEVSKHGGKRDANGLKPTTSRALILRNGKYGARGTEELMLVSRMSGREKLDLLAGQFLIAVW
jgi:hypothetical protein